jgi:hypothetical protein
MEKVKKELKDSYQRYLKEGLSEGEALSKAISEVKGKHEPEKFSRALQEFLKELLDSYKLENLTEADPFIALIESLYEEFELLKPTLQTILKRLNKER